MSIQFFLTEQQEMVAHALKQYVAKLDAPAKLLEAMDYSLMAGGKRIRPAFVMATIEALQGEKQRGLAAACAIEMIHTYSLIHDDLPAMDDDDYRRGKLTSHKVFGEALAILAGDALLTHAFCLLSDTEDEAHLPIDPVVQIGMINELSSAAGAVGMVGGQTADMLGEDRKLTLEELYYIHEHKTADLLTCAVRLGCLVAGANEKEMLELTTYAKHIGLAFQIQDDILDEVGDEQKLGKKVGSDRENDKSTFVSLLGLDGAKDKLLMHVKLSKEALQRIGLEQGILMELADFMIHRDS